MGVVVARSGTSQGFGRTESGRRVTAAASRSHAAGRAATAGTARTAAAANSKVGTDPLTTASVKRYLASRRGKVTAAVEDLSTGQEWLLNRSARDQTASIVKVDILETLLHEHDSSTSALGAAAADAAEAQGMIEASDDDDASDLWEAVGGASAIASYDRLAGLTETTPGADGYWGETLTTAADQIKLLRQLAFPSKLLTPVARRYELSLMGETDADQNWGVSGGVPDGVTVELKDGWVPLTSSTDWEINSIGWVHGNDRNYLIAVLTAHDPSESYGIATIEQLSAAVYSGLKPRA